MLLNVDGQTTNLTTGYLVLVSGSSKVVGQGLAKNAYTGNVRSLSGAGVDRADPYISQIVINN